MSFVRAMVKSGRNHEFILALNRSFPESIDEIRRAFAGLLPASAFVTYSVPPMATAADPLNAWRNRAAELVRAHFLESLSPDVVFVPSLFEGFWDNTVVSVEKDAPYLTAVTLYDLIPLEDMARYLGGEHDRAAYFRRLNDARHADLLLAISRYVADDAVARIGVAESKAIVAYCGVDEMFRAPRNDASEKSSLLASYGITRRYVMTASPLEPRKNIEGLIAGFASMSRDVRDRHQLVLAGKMDAFAKGYIGDLARAEGLAGDAIVLPGFIPDADLPALYHCSSVFAFPSFSEGFGLPLLEAMACGAPVVGSSRTSIPEVLGRSDLAPDPANVIEIGQAIERILVDPALQRELRDFGPRRAALFSWEKSAAIALDALENLRGDSGPSPVTQAQGETVGTERTAMALLMMDVAPEHRLAGLNNALAAALADRFDLTIISSSHAPMSEWLRANCAIRDVNWFETHADHFHHIIYSADYMAGASFRRLMHRQKGSLMLAERLVRPSANMLTGRRLFDGAELAIFESSGFGGLSRAVADEITFDDMIELLVKDMAGRGDSLYVEADSRVEHGANRLGIMPIALSDHARKAFCENIGMVDAPAIVVAIAGCDEAAAGIIQNFRTTFVDAANKPGLVVFCDEDGRSSGDIKISQLISGIFRIGCDLDSVYCGLLSTADILIVDDGLPATIRNRIEIDYPGTRLCWGSDLAAAKLSKLMAAFSPTKNSAKDMNITGATKPGAIEAARQMAADKPARCVNGKALKHFIARLPEEVRGKRPDSNDLGKVAVALARNEVRERSPQIYVDLTAFAKPGASQRLDRITKNWLQAIFQQAGNRIRAIYADGGNFVVANQFAAKMCGIANSCLKDQLLSPRIGDHIIGADLFHSFAESSFDLLRTARDDGVALNYIVLDNLAFQRDTLMPSFARILTAWIDETILSNKSCFAGVSQEQTAAGLHEWVACHEHVQALIEAKIPLAVLNCPALMADTPILPDADLNISPALSDAIEAWRAQKRKPSSVGGVTNTADLGHVVAGHILGSYSLAIINRMLARSLEASFPGQARFMPIETAPIDHTEGVPAADKPLMIELSTRTAPDHGDEVVISHHYPVVVPEGAYRLMMALFFWEESAVPDHTIQLLAKNFDAIISPARTVTNALLDSGLPIPIATIGQPVDLEPYKVLAHTRRPRDREIRFLHVSSCFKRKGVDVLLEAWAKAFTSADPVCLVIKTFPNPHNDVEQQLERLAERYPNLAKVEIVNRDVEHQELVQFYADADVMVLPSRGEGYNLPALEAMASGLPLIVTGHGGQRDFCSDREARLIDYRFASSESHVSGHHSLWVEPDVEDLAAALREQADPEQAAMIEERRQRAILAAARESDKMAWLNRYTAMVDDLLNVSNRETARVAWVSTWGVQCGIAQYSQYLIEHFSPAAQREMTVICDHRTAPRLPSLTRYIPAWAVENVPKIDSILDAVDEVDAEAVIIQHQDGLLSWDQLGRLALDDRLAGKVTVIVLHNAGNMVRASAQELMTLLEGLGKFSRVLVHNVADMNFLLSMGLKHNIGLLPHGAFARDQAPWPRRFGPQDGPIIGCHGFFFRHKGIDKLIRAAAMLGQEWPNLKLRLVNAQFPGEGHEAYISECKALAQSLGVYDAIEWRQEFMPIEQVNSLLSECDIITLPYSESSDSASGAVRVSLASMVPLVATRVKIFAELGEAAAWADNNEPEVLADVIGSLLRSPEKRRTVQAAMHEWLSAHDWNRVAGALEGMIQGLVQEKRLHWDFRRNELDENGWSETRVCPSWPSL